MKTFFTYKISIQPQLMAPLVRDGNLRRRQQDGDVAATGG
jgi:hypothetical protein